jgi:hypothetical protein
MIDAFVFRRCALSINVAAILTACGGSQPPIGAPGALPQRNVIYLARGFS